MPPALGVKRSHAEAFAWAWRRYVGDAELIYTRTPKGRSHLYRARTREGLAFQDLLMDFWR